MPSQPSDDPPQHRLLIYQSSAELGAAWSEYLLQQGLEIEVRHTANRGQLQRWLNEEPDALCALDLADPEDIDLYYDLQMALPDVRPLLTAVHPLTKIVEDLALTGAPIYFVDPPFSQGKFHRAVVEAIEKNLAGMAAPADPPPDTKTVRFAPPMVVPRVTARISGNLKVLLPDLVQLKCLTGSSCVLEISAGNNSGEVFFEKGNIVHAHTGAAEGTDALVEVFTWNNSHFQVHPWREPKSRSIRERWEGLLLNVSRMVDEAKGHDEKPANGSAGSRAA